MTDIFVAVIINSLAIAYFAEFLNGK